MRLLRHMPNYPRSPSSSVMLEFLQYMSSCTYTAFLFVRSDIKDAVAPVVVYGLATAPETSLSRAFHITFWMTVHQLQFNFSNQHLSASIIEDTAKKPFRPIPSGRISRERTTQLRWAIIPFCLLLSYMYSNTVCTLSALFAVIVYVHHELEGSTWRVTRESAFIILCVILELSATLVASTNPEQVLQRQTSLGVLFSALAFGTTIFSQDYKDVEGDKLIGRRTIAIVFNQNITRPLLMLLLICWSLVLAKHWGLGNLATIAYAALAALVGLRYVMVRGCHADQVTDYLYNVWFSVSFALPAYHKVKRLQL